MRLKSLVRKAYLYCLRVRQVPGPWRNCLRKKGTLCLIFQPTFVRRVTTHVVNKACPVKHRPQPLIGSCRYSFIVMFVLQCTPRPTAGSLHRSAYALLLIMSMDFMVSRIRIRGLLILSLFLFFSLRATTNWLGGL
ncbi:hypothetical protein K474DRAFT_1017740 [Panus rudis PR-1116 ss-1]|nr:hypothetical protein K474DRAFT_1017740 [Panus rudis PR-1116 ss-1]